MYHVLEETHANVIFVIHLKKQLVVGLTERGHIKYPMYQYNLHRHTSPTSKQKREIAVFNVII